MGSVRPWGFSVIKESGEPHLLARKGKEKDFLSAETSWQVRAMFRLSITFLALCMGQAALANDCHQFHDPRYVYQAEIIRVYDGDTVFMDIDLGFRIVLHNEPLRLWGVDTPEVRGDERERGIAVRDLVREWLPEGSETIIRTLRARDGSDRTGTFHRYLVVICPDGWSESVNARLLREGHGVLDAQSQSEAAEIARVLGLPSAD